MTHHQSGGERGRKVVAIILATLLPREGPLWVKKRRKTMSAVTAAFAESSRRGLVPKIAPNTARAR
jgi:hypothetical protein